MHNALLADPLKDQKWPLREFFWRGSLRKNKNVVVVPALRCEHGMSSNKLLLNEWRCALIFIFCFDYDTSLLALAVSLSPPSHPSLRSPFYSLFHLQTLLQSNYGQNSIIRFKYNKTTKQIPGVDSWSNMCDSLSEAKLWESICQPSWGHSDSFFSGHNGRTGQDRTGQGRREEARGQRGKKRYSQKENVQYSNANVQ